MAITYPRPISQFAGQFRMSSCVWRVARADEFAGLGSSQSIPIELADPLWGADIELAIDQAAEGRKTSARLNSLEGSIRDFYLFNPLARAPAADPSGSLLGSSTPTLYEISANFDGVRFTGLPANYVLTEGDFFELNWGSSPVRRAPFQLLETVQASAGGVTPTVRVFPNIWPGIAIGTPVNLIDPSGRFFIVPNSLKIGAMHGLMIDGASFSVLQRL
jgi:hypothetical protein